MRHNKITLSQTKLAIKTLQISREEIESSRIDDNSFAAACYNDNHISELLSGPADADAAWGLTQDEANQQARLAVIEMLNTRFC